jgi:hypothetical protein
MVETSCDKHKEVSQKAPQYADMWRRPLIKVAFQHQPEVLSLPVRAGEVLARRQARIPAKLNHR